MSVVVLGLNTSAAKAKDVKLESIQTEVFNQKQAQPTWTALDCCTLTRNSIPHLPRAPLCDAPTHCALQKTRGVKQDWSQGQQQ